MTWTLTPTPGGTRLRLVHAGFVTPRNDVAFHKMNGGWQQVVQNVAKLSGEVSE